MSANSLSSLAIPWLIGGGSPRTWGGPPACMCAARLSPRSEAATESQDTDWLDAQASLRGDGEAYARIVRRHQDTVAAWLWRFTRDRRTCEELAQDTFVEAYFSLRSFRGRSPLVHWLRKIATRVGYRHWKTQKRRGTLVALDAVAEPPASHDDAAGSAEAAERLRAVLAELPPRDRLVLTLMYLEGCSVAEAADLTGWSQTLVKVQAHRARKKLKALLEKRERRP